MIYLISDLHGEEAFDGLNKYLSLYKEGDLLLILPYTNLKKPLKDGYINDYS